MFEDVKHKFHACCHGTHAMIEALRRDDWPAQVAALLKQQPALAKGFRFETPALVDAVLAAVPDEAR